MAGLYDYENAVVNQIKTEISRRAKKKLWGLVKKITIVLAPLFLIIFLVVMAGAGALQVFSVFGGIADAIFGKNDIETRVTYEGDLNSLTLDQILEVVENDQLDKSFYRNLMFSRKEFLHMLTSVKEINEEHVQRTITIDTKHTYQEWVEDDVYAANPAAAGGHYETKVETVPREIQVDSADIEKYQIDWQMVYTMCIANIVNTDMNWTVATNEEGDEEVTHYGENFEDIDSAIEACRMKYDYITDLAREEQTSYTLAECKKMVHTPYLYGNPDTEEGEWEYYVPHSVLRSASSAYSTIYYTSTVVKDPDTEEETTYLSNIAEASFMPLYDLTMRRYTFNYKFDYVCDLMALTPGGNRVAQKLRMYRAYEDSIDSFADDGTSKPGVIIWQNDLTGYVIPDGYTLEDFPTSTKVVSSDRGNIDYDGVKFDDSLAGTFVMAALEKVGCKYSQPLRDEEGYYDCSSLVTRVAAEVGISIQGGTAAGICKNLTNAGRLVSMSDLQQGDLIFYSREVNGRYLNITHVAIYIGNGQIVHARGVKYGVCVSLLSAKDVVSICRPPY